MAELSKSARANLPNSAFAYIDSQGNRRLPINDESHVRNALSRFNQVKFEDEAARERAFRKVLTAATKYGIAPVGFVARQLREAAAREGSSDLPSGPVTFLFSDIEGSTSLLQRLGDGYPATLSEVKRLIGSAVDAHGGYEVDARADEFFAAFADAGSALEAAIEVQRSMRDHAWPQGNVVKVRIGLHSGEPARTETGYVGLPVNTGSRVCDAGHGGQILVSGATREMLGADSEFGGSLIDLGSHQLRGLDDPVALFQASVGDLPMDFPPVRSGP
jgi:class 3 adenylate cyclase